MDQHDSDLKWMALGRVDGLGRLGFKRLVDFFGDPTRAFGASSEALRRVVGLSAAARNGLLRFDAWDALARELDRVTTDNTQLIRYCDEDYPFHLRQIPDPPPTLFVKGSLREWHPAVGVVGSRACSDYGRRITRELCAGLVSLGISVVSGMARGIDGVAHTATLSASGKTIAVLGSGIDVIYPRENQPLAERIAACGALVSEFRAGTPPLPGNFPVRNRIISGLTLGVVVIEAAEKSGSLITARLAAEQGREVFAVPGPAGSSRSRGTHRLIKEGAKLVEGIADIVEEILPHLAHASSVGAERAAAPLPDLPEPARQILSLLNSGPLQIEQLIDESGLSAAHVSEILLELELQGILTQLPGKRFELHYPS